MSKDKQICSICGKKKCYHIYVRMPNKEIVQLNMQHIYTPYIPLQLSSFPLQVSSLGEK